MLWAIGICHGIKHLSLSILQFKVTALNNSSFNQSIPAFTEFCKA